MTAGSGLMPELGSKISLISKADIRYEGRLFTVDPQECTIALANVRSFGTEDRDTPYPIAPQPTIYDYIMFRGSDIKDIRVVNNVTIPNDPAIMQMHLPPNQIPPQQQGFPPQSFPPMQPQAGQYAPFNQMQGPPPPIVGNNNPLQNIPQQQQQTPQQPIQQTVSSPNQSQQSNQQGNTTNNLTSTSSVHSKKSSELTKVDKTSDKSSSQSSNSQTTAPINTRKQSNKSQDSRSDSPNARKSPTSDMGVQTNQREGGNKDRMQRNQRNNNMQHNHERRDSGRNERNNERNDHRSNNDRNNETFENKGGYRQNNQRMQSQRGGYHNHNNRNNHMRGNQGGSGRMRAPPNFYRPNNHNQNKPNGVGPQNNQGRTNANNKNTLKFENEFDFEQANSKFEELRTQLAKLKVGTEENKTPEQVNGEVEKKDDSGNETGADHEAEGDDAFGYDRNKSFFDNISCEASERSKGKNSRPDWRQERKINSETFGLSMNRRGNMRGRGYYNRTQYNNNRPNYRQGVPPQYRNSNNRNNTNNNNNNRNVQNNSGRTNNPGQQTQQPPQNPQPVAAK